MTFEDLGLGPEILKALADAGYQTPTPIQEQAIPYVLMGRDVLGCAQTGTGKTAGFTLPMIEILASGRAKARMPRSLILAPTRELAAQVAESFERYGKYHKLTQALLIGGSSFAEQLQLLDRGVDVLIATPGRMLDLFERGKILLADVKILVIDEADRMLDMGFMPDVERIVGLLPKIRQTLFFSATMPPEIRRLSDKFLMNPKEVAASPPATAAVTVEQQILRTSDVPKDKRASLRALIRAEDVKSALVFCNRKRDVGVLFRSLQRHGFSVGELHGDMAQPVRMETLAGFKDGKVQILVCSDVAARGLDIPKVSHVFNFDVPVAADDYVHRIGRTGRAGREGRSFTLVTRADAKGYAAVTRMLGRKLPEVSLDGAAPEPFEAPEEELRERPARRSDRRRRGRGASTREEPVAAEARRGDRSRDERGRDDNRRRQRPDRALEAEAEIETETETETETGSNIEPLPKSGRSSKPFGDDTPAFLLRPVKLAATA